LLAKTAFQPLKTQRMSRPFREQARSHNPWVARYIGGVGRFDERAFAREWDLPAALDIA
jgi:hypothetical protein